MNAAAILGKVEAKRLQKAVDGLVTGAYTVQVTEQNELTVCGWSRHGKEIYQVSLADTRGWGDCPDSEFHHTACKHVTLLPSWDAEQALHRATRANQLGLGQAAPRSGCSVTEGAILQELPDSFPSRHPDRR